MCPRRTLTPQTPTAITCADHLATVGVAERSGARHSPGSWPAVKAAAPDRGAGTWRPRPSGFRPPVSPTGSSQSRRAVRLRTPRGRTDPAPLPAQGSQVGLPPRVTWQHRCGGGGRGLLRSERHVSPGATSRAQGESPSFVAGVLPPLLLLRVAKGPGSVRDGTESSLCLPPPTPAVDLPRPPQTSPCVPSTCGLVGKKNQSLLPHVTLVRLFK